MPTISLSCIDGDPLLLMGGTPVGGDYAGSGIDSNILNPQNAGIGLVNVTYTYTEPSTGCSNSDMDFIEIHELPNAQISGDTVVCLGETTTLSVNENGDISWSNGTSTATNEVSPLVSQDYSVIVINQAGCSASDMISVTVNPIPNPEIDGNLNICDGEETILIASGGTTYSWSTGDTTDSIAVSITDLTSESSPSCSIYSFRMPIRKPLIDLPSKFV